VNTLPEKEKSADSFEIKGFSELNTATSLCFRLDHQPEIPRSGKRLHGQMKTV